MTDLSREELIGAYLDDELSSEQRARVEKLLAESEESRQLLEELRSLRSHLQALPRLTLPADFSQQVLKRAEREMLLGRTSAGEARAAVARAEDDRPATIPFGRRWVRPLVYATMATAAALAIAVFLPNQLEDHAGTRLASDTAREAEPTEGMLAGGDAQRQAPADAVVKSGPAPGPGDGSMPAFRQNDARPMPKEMRSPAPAAAPDDARPQTVELADSADDVLVVECRITREAFVDHAFEQLLGEASIEVARDEAGAGEETDQTETLVFYVEATPKELEAALKALEERAGEFPAVELDPAADDGRQVEWRERFGRAERFDDAELAPPAEDRDATADAAVVATPEALRGYVGRLLSEQAPLSDAEPADSSLARRLRTKVEAQPTESPSAEPEAQAVVADEANRAPAAVGAPAESPGRSAGGPERVRAVFVLRVVAAPATAEPAPVLPERD